MDDEAVAVSGTGPEDAVVILGSGILGSTPFERQTDRYGAVHLTVLDSIPGEAAPARTVPVPPDDDLAARILQELAKGDARYADAAAAASEDAARRPDTRVVAFDHAPVGTAGTLVAHIIATTKDDFWGDRPKPGERVVLGSGTLFTEEYMGAPVIGVRPADGRADNWMDRDAISRCRDHLVRMEFETPKAGEPGAAAARRSLEIETANHLVTGSAGLTQESGPLPGPLDFPDKVRPRPPSQAAASPGTPARTRAETATPTKSARAR